MAYFLEADCVRHYGRAINVFWKESAIPSIALETIYSSLMESELTVTSEGGKVPELYNELVIKHHWVKMIYTSLQHSMMYGFFVFAMKKIKLISGERFLVPVVIPFEHYQMSYEIQTGWTSQVADERAYKISKFYTMIITDPLPTGELTSRSQHAINHYKELKRFQSYEDTACKVSCIPTGFCTQRNSKQNDKAPIKWDHKLAIEKMKIGFRAKRSPMDTKLVEDETGREQTVNIRYDVPENSEIDFAPHPVHRTDFVSLSEHYNALMRDAFGVPQSSANLEHRRANDRVSRSAETDQNRRINSVVSNFREHINRALLFASLHHRKYALTKAGKDEPKNLKVYMESTITRNDLDSIFPYLTDDAKKKTLSRLYSVPIGDLTIPELEEPPVKKPKVS